MKQRNNRQERREVFAYLITRRIDEPFYALFPNSDGASWTRVEYDGRGVNWTHFLETRDAIQFLLTACDAAYAIAPIFTAQPITERRHMYYEAKGYTL